MRTDVQRAPAEYRAGSARWGEARAALLREGGRESPPLIDRALRGEPESH
jgi:hypothetical protein